MNGDTMKRRKFDFSKEYGIVLEGGGAKGAYQIGVWKALLECGVKIKGIAGVSVGALNGALMCMGNLDKAIDIWKNISYSKIMNVNDMNMEKIMGRRFKEISLQEIRRQSIKFISEGGFDITPLRQLIEENVDEQAIKASNMELILGTFSLTNLKEIEISVNEIEEGNLKDYLIASASFPLFKNTKLNGKKYLDGGIINNVPIDMLINRGYKDIIVVRIYGIGLEKKVKIPEDVNVTVIAPGKYLCNVLEFNPKKAARNINLGYYDALRMLKSLDGRDYYISDHQVNADGEFINNEEKYLDALLRVDEERVENLLNFCNKAALAYDSPLRNLTEIIYPHLANLLGLEKNWDYRELYYVLLEYAAKKLRIPRFRIYTREQFAQTIEQKMQAWIEKENLPNTIMDLVLTIIKE